MALPDALQAIFVFGSNRAGAHGAGAAAHAKSVWGAEEGVGDGPTGRAYALATEDENRNPLPADAVASNITRLVAHAVDHPDQIFLLTPVGCGYAGFDPLDIARMVIAADPPANVALTPSWLGQLVPSGDLT